MVKVKVVVVGVLLPPPPLEEPQPATHNDPAMSDAPRAARNDHSTMRDRFLALPNPNNEINPQGMTQPKASLCCGASAGA
jgi:hypothetical protein